MKILAFSCRYGVGTYCNLDKNTAKGITTLLKDSAHNSKCVVVVSHSNEVASAADVVFNLIHRRVQPV